MPKKKPLPPPEHSQPYTALKALIGSLYSRPYFGLPVGTQTHLEPYRANRALSLINEVNTIALRIAATKRYLSPRAQAKSLPRLRRQLRQLKAEYEALLNER